MAQDQPLKGPFKLVTVNTAPERARRLIGRMIEALKTEYRIEHVANCESTRPSHPIWSVRAYVNHVHLQPSIKCCQSFPSKCQTSWYVDRANFLSHEADGHGQFCASMWTQEEVKKIRSIAEATRPGIAVYALPRGLQVEKGPDAVVEHLVQNVPALLDHATRS